MVGLLLPNNRTNVLIAAAIAHFNGGYFQQNDPPGWITIECDGLMKVERKMIFQALGRPCSDDMWEALLVRPQGAVVQQDENLIVVQQVEE